MSFADLDDSNGTVTAGNASPFNDGAAALLTADEARLARLDREPLARVGAGAVSAIEPNYFGLAPVEAVRKALTKAGRGFGDLRRSSSTRRSPPRFSAVWPRWAELAQLRAARAQAAEEAFDDFGAAVLHLRDGLSTRPDFAELQQVRASFDRPALSPEQIRAQARASWAEFERRHGLGAGGTDAREAA